MITRFATLTSRFTLGLALLMSLYACGGGGGGGGGGFLPEPGEDDVTYALTLTLLDADGNPTSSVTSTTPATLEVRVNRNNDRGVPVADALVSATTSLGVIAPDTGTALSNAEGIATLQVSGDGQLGAGTITVSVDAPAGTVTEALNFSIDQAALRLGSFADGVFRPGVIGISGDTLPRNGSAELTVFVVDGDGEPVSTEQEVRFRSDCERSGLAELPVSATTTDGRVTVEYTVAGCSGTDTVTASIAGLASTATTNITVAPPGATSIVFDSAEPAVLALRGTGGGSGLQETGAVTFIVSDSDNVPIQGVAVDFSLSTTIGGLSLVRTRAVSNTEGIVSATVQSGNVATAVRVIATIMADTSSGTLDLSTVSDVLAVTTGLPDQNSVSLSATELTVRGAREFDGITSEITVRMADKFNNPVPDGTAAVFQTEYGSIQGSCVTDGGACSVIWTSQAPRFPTFNSDLVRTTRDSNYSCPSHNVGFGPCPDDLGYIRGLRSTILVTALGEESFIDANGNGLYDEGESFQNLTEAFLDHNEDGRYNPAQGCVSGAPANCAAAGSEETFVDLNSDGTFSRGTSSTFPNGLYNGVLCPPAGDGVYCSRELVNVRDSLVLVMGSDSNFDILVVDNSTRRQPSVLQAGRTYTVYVADIYNNAPAGGSTVSVTGDGCEVSGSATDFEVVDSNSIGALTLPAFSIVENAGGSITISVDGGGVTVARDFSCQAAPEPECDPNTDPDCLVPGGGP
ncbi:MAG: hypothetical protein NXH81_00065 [Halieaceae bacterium]|uniref:hypothetical protein n=1 Tax=Haliea alexandrii TaxID=2448162 RepID=UPI0013049125|nr:hypothetical protein [Haliea alexandrii]MCR9183767.1 hypothetical protein [Halieaceae bacterium]